MLGSAAFGLAVFFVLGFILGAMAGTIGKHRREEDMLKEFLVRTVVGLKQHSGLTIHCTVGKVDLGDFDDDDDDDDDDDGDGDGDAVEEFFMTTAPP